MSKLEFKWLDRKGAASFIPHRIIKNHGLERATEKQIMNTIDGVLGYEEYEFCKNFPEMSDNIYNRFKREVIDNYKKLRAEFEMAENLKKKYPEQWKEYKSINE